MNSFDEFHYCNSCHVCKSVSGLALSCIGCGSYRYCSEHHREVHAEIHRERCSTLAPPFRAILSSESEWTIKRLGLKAVLESVPSTRPSPCENQIWMFPRACVACKTTDSSRLKDCKDCASTSFCCDDHKYLHKTETCRTLRLQFRYYRRLLNDPFDPYVYPDSNIPYARVEKETFLDPIPTDRDDDLFRLFYADRLSSVFTLLHAIRTTGLVQKCPSELKIHIVGANNDYVHFDRKICELLFHWIPNLKNVRIALVGPEVQRYDDDDWEMCDRCRRADIRIVHNFHARLYSEYSKHESYFHPDAVAVFNCGFHEFSGTDENPWKGSVPLLLVRGATLLTTSYTRREAIEDFKILTTSVDKKVRVDIKMTHEINPYRSAVPLRDWVDDNEFYYRNNFYTVLQVMK